MRSLRIRPAEASRGALRRLVFGLSVSAPGASPAPASFPPNKSFKPTPCRGVGHVLYATLARVRCPATGRLNSGVRRQKNIRFQPQFSCPAAPLIFAPLPPLAAVLVVSSHHAMLRIVRLARSRFTSVAFGRFRNGVWHGQCSTADTVASDTSG